MKFYCIGIDPGVATGMSVWDGKDFLEIGSTMIHRAMAAVKIYAEGKVIVRMEDARKRAWFGKMDIEQHKYGSAVREGAGSIKRDCQIWEDFLIDNHIPYELVPPKNNKTKLKAGVFQKITGWKAATNEHGRDSAMLVFGYNCREKFTLNRLIHDTEN